MHCDSPWFYGDLYKTVNANHLESSHTKHLTFIKNTIWNKTRLDLLVEDGDVDRDRDRDKDADLSLFIRFLVLPRDLDDISLIVRDLDVLPLSAEYDENNE